MNRMFNDEENEYPELSETAIRAYFTADNDRKRALKRTRTAIVVCFAVIGLGWLISLALNSVVAFSYPSQINSLAIFIGATFLLFVIGTISIVNKFKAQLLSDQEYDAWLEGTAQSHFMRALDRLGVDNDQDFGPILYVHGFILPGTRDASKFRLDDILFKVGRDGNFRYSINRYTYFHPIVNQLAVFIFEINAVNHSDYREATKEYFYQDIVGATTEDDHDMVLINSINYPYRIQSFALSISSGYNISATFRSQPLDNRLNLPIYNIPDVDLVDDTIMRLRRLIRDNKQGQQSR
ncbi:MAG TPA: hypothetical protein VFQ36_17790 [Ktedonobacteraceae bacterium]|nr:hypothetical protein [Ktedonobacteraceae bacterium]